MQHQHHQEVPPKHSSNNNKHNNHLNNSNKHHHNKASESIYKLNDLSTNTKEIESKYPEDHISILMNLGVSRQVRMNEWCELILWMTDVYIHTLSATIYRRQSMRLTWRQETQTWLQVCYFKCDHFRVFEIPRLDSLLLLLFFLISRSLFSLSSSFLSFTWLIFPTLHDSLSGHCNAKINTPYGQNQHFKLSSR